MSNLKNIKDYLYNQRWCNFKSEISNGQVCNITFNTAAFGKDKILAVGRVEFADKKERCFMMPLKRAKDPADKNSVKLNGVTYKDAVAEKDFWTSLVSHFEKNRNRIDFPCGWHLEFEATSASVLKDCKNEASRPLGVEQSNTTVVVGDKRLAFKLERILAFSENENPEFEMNKKLMRDQSLVMPQTYGFLVLYNDKNQKASSGIIQEFVKNKGDMWNYSLKYIKEKLYRGYADHVLLNKNNCPEFMALIDRLGQKTQEMLDCLSQKDDNPAFTPQQADAAYLRTYQKQMEVLLYQTKRNIADNLENLPEPSKTQTRKLLKNWDGLTSKFVSRQIKKIRNSPAPETICRVHGDFHLGQVLVTEENDLKFTDFAGEPALPLEQRKQKHIAVRDYAGMYRSLDGYLGAVAIEDFAAETTDAAEAAKRRQYAQKALKPLINEASRRFLGRHTLDNPWLSLEIFRKNLYEVNYEVCHRPQMAYIPISGLNKLFTDGSLKTKTNGKEK